MSDTLQREREYRTHIVAFKCTRAEREAIFAEAAREGVAASQLVRSRVFGKRGKRVKDVTSQ